MLLLLCRQACPSGRLADSSSVIGRPAIGIVTASPDWGSTGSRPHLHLAAQLLCRALPLGHNLLQELGHELLRGGCVHLCVLPGK